MGFWPGSRKKRVCKRMRRNETKNETTYQFLYEHRPGHHRGGLGVLVLFLGRINMRFLSCVIKEWASGVFEVTGKVIIKRFGHSTTAQQKRAQVAASLVRDLHYDHATHTVYVHVTWYDIDRLGDGITEWDKQLDAKISEIYEHERLHQAIQAIGVGDNTASTGGYLYTK
jgi:hypothetical protein